MCWPISVPCTPAGVPVTFYATLAAEQVGFVAGDCAARIAVLDGADQLARWQPVLASLPGLSTIIVRDASACPAGEQYLTWDDFAALGRERLAADPGLVTGRLAAVSSEDPVTLLYTSGTTGNPKGVLLTHHCVLYEVAAAKLGGTSARTSAGSPTCRWPTSRSACSASTCRSARPGTCTSAPTRSS